MKHRSAIVLTLITLAALAGAVVFFFLQRAAASPCLPEIRFDSAPLRVSIDVSDEELLQDVTAIDPEDGDVTDSLIVEGISHLMRDATATVTYAAFDATGHVTKAERTIQFTDYTLPRFRLSAPLLFSVGDRVDLLALISASDPLDGDLTDRVRYSITNGSTSLGEVGAYEIELRVTNRMGGSSVLLLPLEITAGNPNPARITLSDYLIYLPAGSSFDPADYVTEYRTDGTTVYSAEGLTIDSDVDTTVPGIYTATYSYEAASLSRTRLIVVVE